MPIPADPLPGHLLPAGLLPGGDLLQRLEDRVELLRRGVEQAPQVPVLLLAGLLALTVAALAGRRWAGALLVVDAGAFALFNGPLEGPVLVVISSQRGLTASDVLVAAALLVAGTCLLRGRPARAVRR